MTALTAFRSLRSNFIHISALASSIFTISLLWGVPFICMDDMFSAFARIRFNGLWEASKTLAFTTGRFYQLFYYTLTQLPYYLFHSLPQLYIARMLVPALTVVTFWTLIYRLFRSARFASLTILFFTTFIQATEGYNSFHSLIWWFNLGWLFCLFGLILYQAGIVNERRKLIWLSAGLFGVGMMAYESLLFYGILFPLIWMHEKGKLTKAFVRSILPLVMFYAVYITAYITFRKFSGGGYVGTAPSSDSPVRIFKTVWLFTRNGLILRFPHPRAWTGISGIAIMMGLLFGLGCLSYFTTTKKSEKPFASRFGLAIIVFSLSFLSNVLYGFIERYRSWAEDVPIYHGNYFSAFFLALTISLLFSYFSTACSQRNKRIPAILVTVFVSLLAVQATNFNSRFFTMLRASAPVWQVIESDLSKEMFSSLRPHEKTVSKYLNDLPYLSPTLYNYWDYYFEDRIGKQPVFVPSNAKNAPEITTTYEAVKQGPHMLTYFSQKQDNGIYRVFLSSHLGTVEAEIMDSKLHPLLVRVKSDSIIHVDLTSPLHDIRIQ